MKIAFTFDDGPTAVTDSLLNCFAKHGGHATFFVLGNRLHENENKARILRTLEYGHEVANHSYDHPFLSEITEAEVIAQITKTDNLLNEIIDKPLPPFMRAPYFNANDETKKIIGSLGYALIEADIDTKDWMSEIEPSVIYENVMSQVCDGSIILMHDTRNHTYEAVEKLIPELTRLGYEMVTVSELLKERVGTITPGVSYQHAK